MEVISVCWFCKKLLEILSKGCSQKSSFFEISDPPDFFGWPLLKQTSYMYEQRLSPSSSVEVSTINLLENIIIMFSTWKSLSSGVLVNCRSLLFWIFTLLPTTTLSATITFCPMVQWLPIFAFAIIWLKCQIFVSSPITQPSSIMAVWCTKMLI